MATPILNKRIEMALRIAIRKGGTLGYNPDMYKLGFADNLTPSKEFNDELKKYGHLKYSYSTNYDLGCYSPIDYTWNSFTINERGREIIREIDKERNGTYNQKKIFRFVKSLTWILSGTGIGIAFFCLVAYFFANIDYSTEYTWVDGILHAICVIPNFIMHCFDSDILYYAEYHSTAYTVFFWIIFITSVIPGVCKFIWTIFIEILREWYKPF